MYDAAALLDRIDDHTAPILIGFAIAMACQTVWLVHAVVMARRERVYSLPLFLTFFWFAHDVGCVVRFDNWFNTYDHWFLKCYWVGLLSAMLLELVFLAQAVRYGREELLPGWSERAFAALIAGGALAAVLTWELLKQIMDDPLYQSSPALTLMVAPLFGAALLIRRGSPAGQSVLMWAGCTGISVAWWVTTVGWYGQGFEEWRYIAVGAVTITAAATMTGVVARMRAAQPVAVS